MKVFFVSLGCDKNTVDAQMMLGLFADAGHTLTDDEESADVIVVNTCAFIKDAKMESIETLLQMAEHKKNGNLKYLIATGCLAQRYKDEIINEIPEVDLVIGNQGYDKIVELLAEMESSVKKNTYIPDINGEVICGYRRVLTGASHYAYIKIAEGCAKRCTYCIIPSIRGNYRSVPMEILTDEAKKLADAGVSELIVVAQETTLYGVDLYGEKRLHELLKEFAKIDGIKKIRVLYCYPEEITDELIDTIANEPKICNYLDIPIQSCSDNVLIKMGRRAREAGIRELISKLRSRIPDICIRTTLISGFPGESRRDFLTTYNFVKEAKFDRLGVFTYSAEENTAAAGFDGQIPEFIKSMRRNKIMKLQQKIVFEKNESMVGRRIDAVIDGKLVSDGVYVGRTYRDAPDVDGLVFISSDRDLLSGDIIDIEVTGAKGYDLIATEITE